MWIRTKNKSILNLVTGTMVSTRSNPVNPDLTDVVFLHFPEKEGLVFATVDKELTDVALHEIYWAIKSGDPAYDLETLELHKHA